VWEARFSASNVPSLLPQTFHESKPLQRSSRQARTLAVKIDDEGWIGVAADLGRCHGHRHPTPELAKLCALNRAQPVGASGNVLLLPVSSSSPRAPRRASGNRS
jgi:hypothetical protein